MITVLRRFELDLLFLLIIVLITFLAWHGILNQSIAGEGFYYFSPIFSFILPDGRITDILHNFDNFARFGTYTLETLYKGEMQVYMNTQFLIIILVNIFIYISLKIITGKSLLAFIATLYFTSNYTGNFQIYARGHYQWFMQRVPEFFPVLISMIFLNKFIDLRRFKYYILSLIFFTIAIFFTHYTTLFLPFFPSFLIISAIIYYKNQKEIMKAFFYASIFVLINYLIIHNSNLSFGTLQPNKTFLESILQLSEVPQKISFQLVVVTIPFTILQFLNDLTGLNYQNLVFKLILPTYLMYLAIGFYLYKIKSKSLHFFIACFLGLLGALYLNIYLGRVVIYNEIEQGRYFYIPKLYIGIIVAAIFYNFLITKSMKTVVRVFKYSFIFLLITLYGLSTVNLIWEKMHDSQYEYTGGRLLMNYLNNAKYSLPDGSIVMLSQPLMPLGEDFLKKYYRVSDVKFLYIDSKWKEKIPDGFDINKLYVFDFNDEFKRGGKADLTRIEVVDESKKYREEFQK